MARSNDRRRVSNDRRHVLIACAVAAALLHGASHAQPATRQPATAELAQTGSPDARRAGAEQRSDDDAEQRLGDGAERRYGDDDAAARRSDADAERRPSEALVTPLLTKSLDGIDGKEVSMSVVEYAPGGASPPHRHNADVFVYVLEGSVVMQVAGDEAVTLKAGQTFHESPADIHAVSRNASSTEPARFLAVLVKEEGAPATLPLE